MKSGFQSVFIVNTAFGWLVNFLRRNPRMVASGIEAAIREGARQRLSCPPLLLQKGREDWSRRCIEALGAGCCGILRAHSV